jgi:glutaredoxin 3
MRCEVALPAPIPHYPLIMPKIEIYTSFLCPYCSRAKALLTSKNATYQEIDISVDRSLRAQMMERAGGRTSVPQIFIGGQHVGGSDDLAALNQAGKLDPLLAR